MKKGQVYEGIIETTQFPNKGIIHIDNKKVIIKGALKGQKVSFTISKLRSERAEARLNEVIEKSFLEDIIPACPHFDTCGGCAYQNLSYENQLTLKEGQVKELLLSACDNFDWQGIKGSPIKYEYRNKMEFSFGDEYKDGPLTLGMHKKNSFYDIVSITDCKIVSNDYNLIVKSILEFCKEKNYTFYKKMSHVGLLRHLVLRRSVKTNDIMINFVTTSESDVDTNLLTKRLLELKLSGNIVGIIHTINDCLADIVQSDSQTILYGNDYFYENILGLNFRISPYSFFQTNSLGAELLYTTARSYISTTKDKVVFDLYSGTGTIAQMLANVASKVIGVEIVKEAVDAAKINATLNNLDNCEFIAGDVLNVLDDITEKPDIIVVDPPRSGINPKALKKIAQYNIPEIVYISCNPITLANDIIEFKQYGYSLAKACSIDMFPGTVHVETIALLSKSLS